MDRSPRRVEGIHLQPAGKVERIARSPDNGGDAGLGQVEPQQGIGHAFRVWCDVARLGLLGQIKPLTRHVGIGGIQHRQVVCIPQRDVAGQIGFENHFPVGKGLRAADQRHATAGQFTKVNGMAAVGAADCNGYMISRGVAGFGVPHAKHAQPPYEITPAVAAGWPVMGPDRKIDTTARAHQFIRDLRAGRTGTDHQNAALGQLVGVAVGKGMDLVESGIGRHDGRNDRPLEGACGRHDIGRFDGAGRCFRHEAAAIGLPVQCLHFRITTDGC